MHNNIYVNAVICDAAKKKVANHFRYKMKNIVDVHLKLNCKKSHAATGKLVSHGIWADPKKADTTGKYVYNDEKNLNLKKQKIYVKNKDGFRKWLYDYAKKYLTWTILSYEKFKEKVKLNDDENIGAVFYTKNYQVTSHWDKDWSEWAVGFVFDIDIVKEGYFIHPEYSVTIKLASNSIWYWRT